MHWWRRGAPRAAMACSLGWLQACSPATPARLQPEPVASAPLTLALPMAPSPAPSSGAAQLQPLGPQLILVNDTTAKITPYASYLVDVEGKRPTQRLWQPRRACPRDPGAVPGSIEPNGGHALLPLPVRAHALDGCALGATPPPGRYLLRIDSGLSSDLYAAGQLTLPLTQTVALPFESHRGRPHPCRPQEVARAARLVIANARTHAKLPAGFLNGCDPTEARCSTSKHAAMPPAERCTITMYQRRVRIDRATFDDTPRTLIGWMDRESSYSRNPGVMATTASYVTVGSKRVYLVGTTSTHLHTHGGDAAKIGFVSLKVFNPLDRPVVVRGGEVAFLSDHSCGVPTKEHSKTAITSLSTQALPPGNSELSVSFAARSAYQGHCDRFATRVSLTINGKPTSVTCEHNVSRIEPIDLP